MKRRQFVALMGGALAAPFAIAQQPRRPFRVAHVSINSLETRKQLSDALELGLREQGYVIGQNLILEQTAGDGNPARLPELVERALRSKPDVVVTGVNAVTLAVAARTKDIPIVTALGTDLTSSGLVRTLARPGGNVTGFTADVDAGIAGKRIQLLKEVAPRVSRIGVFWEPPYKGTFQTAIDAAVSALCMSASWVEFSGDLEADFAKVVKSRADAVFFVTGTRPYALRKEVAALLSKHRLPAAMYGYEFVEAGCLMSYAANFPALYRQAARHIDRILKGAKPGDLPIEAPTVFELVINLRTAQALGLKIPPPVLLRADRVIE